KHINDTLGHAVGDQVLKLVADSLSAAVRGADLVNRYGGDEFLVLLGEISQAADAERVAEKIIALLGVPRRIGEHVLRLTASIGISVYPEDGDDVQTLIDHADAAMYQAKAYGLGSFVFHGSDLGHPRQARGAARGSMSRSLTHYRRSLVTCEHFGAQLREANEQLLLAALNAQELQAAAELALKRQVERLAVVAHELRTPLTVVHGYLDMLDPEDFPDSGPMLVEMRKQSQRMAQLVEDLLTLSRLESQEDIGEEHVAMAPMLATLRREAEAYSQGRHTIEVIDRAGCDLLGSNKELHSAFSNLVTNAVRYTPAGGTVTLVFAREGDGVALAVRDTGYGIPASHLPRITERFYRVSSSRSRGSGGTGLGLSIVKHVLSLHQARLEIDSEVGKGSAFSCHFAAARVVAREAGAPLSRSA
ncbi:diguanylate cyclase, partial [Xanthomonas sp. Kuri4-3]